MTKINQVEYANVNNGGKEIITKKSGALFIKSFVPLVGWTNETEIPSNMIGFVLKNTGAPSNILESLI